MTVDVEDRIRGALQEVADHIDFVVDAGADLIELAPERRRRPVRALLAAAAVVAIAVAGVAVAIGSSSDHHSAPATAFTPPSTSGATPTTSDPVTPSDPTSEAALTAWAGFPVDRQPRPLILIEGPVNAPEHGFTDPDIRVADAQKEAFDAGAISAPASLPTGPATAGGYPIIGVADALARLRASGSGTASTTLTTTDVRLGTASFDTDRGPMTLPAWLFSFQGVSDPAAVLAVAQDALFEPPAGGGAIEVTTARYTADPRVLTVFFVGSPPGAGPCEAEYTAHIAESRTAVSVSVSTLPNPVPPTSVSAPIACTLMGYARHLTITLRDPLDARVLVDKKGSGPVTVDR